MKLTAYHALRVIPAASLLVAGLLLMPTPASCEEPSQETYTPGDLHRVERSGKTETDYDKDGNKIEEREYFDADRKVVKRKTRYDRYYKKNKKPAEESTAVTTNPDTGEVVPLTENTGASTTTELIKITRAPDGTPLTKAEYRLRAAAKTLPTDTGKRWELFRFYRWTAGPPARWVRDQMEEKRRKKEDEGGKEGKKQDTRGAMVLPGKSEPGLYALASVGSIEVELAGTGETIGHIADLRLRNSTDRPLTCRIPPMVLISASGESQHYASPFTQTVSIPPKKSRTVPVQGACIVRTKPPVGKGVRSELFVQDLAGRTLIPAGVEERGDRETPKFSANTCRKLLSVTASYYQAAEILEKRGAYKDMPYRNPEMRKEIAVQWGLWTDTRIAKPSGEKPATRKDLTATVYKQAEQKGNLTPEKKEKLDQGVGEIFEDVQLTSKEAKNQEDEDAFAGIELTGIQAKGETG